MLGVAATIPTLPVPKRTTRVGVERPCPKEWDDGRAANDEWLATVAHELRSPLATVVQALESIPGGYDVDRDTRWAHDLARRQAWKALQLVEDLFDACAGFRGKLSLRKEVVDLAEIVAGATETVGHLLTTRRHRLTVSLPPEPVILDGDALRLEQVLTNLLTNAAKFTDPGGHIRLTVEVEDGHIVVRIQDNGRGIAPDLLPRVFDLFHQGLDSGNQAVGGLGIGLALVKSLVELHDGSVTAFSDGLGRGSEFVVRLPTGGGDS
jgi:signal transduction histidine kinase